MYEIDNEKFGVFLTQLRKEKNLTQKELAQKLFVSDKAVSKWERGLSMPDIALLFPLSDLLGVTVTELLSGQFIREPEHLNVREVEKLVTGTIGLSTKERHERKERRKRYIACYLACLAAVAVEAGILLALGFTCRELLENLALTELLCLLFGAWFCLFVKETLPAYYDENKISSYSDGIFRMNLAGVRFNNSNWPHILRAGRVWTLSVAVLFPLLYFLIARLFPAYVWESCRLYFSLTACLGLFVPMIVAGKRYE